MQKCTYDISSRYQQEFVEGPLLGSGGFGAVYSATNKLDRVTYAVNKVEVLLSSHVLLLKMLREVILLARLSHPHIVAYWYFHLETTTKCKPTFRGYKLIYV